MKGFEFEEFLEDVFQTHGYRTKVTRKSGDFGSDLILHKKGCSIVVQAKRHSKNIGVKAIQEVHAAKSVYKAHEAWVVTNQDFTKQARTLARATGVKLIGRDGLIKLIYEANNKQKKPRSFPLPSNKT